MDRQTALGLTFINLLATPGLGTIMAGNFLAGLVQLIFASAGFVLIMLFFLGLFRSMAGGSGGPAWHWQLGISLFGIGWLGSAWSSYRLVAKATANIPPKLDGTLG